MMASRPSIPKLSLSFKKTTADSAPLSAQPEKGKSQLGEGGCMSAPLTAVSLPKLNLPARGSLVANGDSSVQAAAAKSASAPEHLPHHHQPQYQPNGQPGAHHAVFLLLPGLNFPSQPPGEPPLTVGALKALCCDTLCPPPPSSSSSPASTPPQQLEFFRLSALVRLTDDTVPAPPGIVVAGAHLMHQDLTLGLVERVVAENRGLRERAELAGEALETLEARAERDARTIRLLRESLDALTGQHRALQDKYDALLLSSTTTTTAAAANNSSSNNNHSSSFAAVGSYGTSSSLTASLSSSATTTTTTTTATAMPSHSASLSAPASAAVSPRGVSPRLHVGSGAHPHTLSQTPRTFHNSFPSLTSPRSPSRPGASGAASGSALFSPRSGEGLISPATSPRRRLACRTGNCTCTAFNPQPSASWICVCGHMSLKHAGGGPP